MVRDGLYRREPDRGAGEVRPHPPRPLGESVDALLLLQRSAGNRAVAASLAVQRQIVVGPDEVTYGMAEAREFRRALMLELPSYGYPAVGTKKMWAALDTQLAGGRAKFDTWEGLIRALVSNGLLDKQLPSSGIMLGPRGLGIRPTWGKETAQAIAKWRDGQGGLAARHVIASSTLGRAIEQTKANDGDLAQWIWKNLGEDPGSTSRQQKQRRIWQHVHNHAGNLWMGSTGANTAIGFIRGHILGLKGKLEVDGDGNVNIDGLRTALKGIEIEGGRNTERNLVWNTLVRELDGELEQLRANPDKDLVEDLIEMYYRNADVDPPALTGNEYQQVVGIWEALQDPGRTLQALDAFLALHLGRSIAFAKPQDDAKE